MLIVCGLLNKPSKLTLKPKRAKLNMNTNDKFANKRAHKKNMPRSLR